MLCDKCNRLVPLSNDAVALQCLRDFGHLPYAIQRLMYGARHLLPTADCEGSPSRAQYLEGMPQDTRGYEYFPDHEKAWRDAYDLLLEIVKAEMEQE